MALVRPGQGNLTQTRKTLKGIYGTTDATAIKLEILWLHLQALMNAHYPCDKPGTPEHAAMQRYKLHWVQSGQKRSPE